jgi:PKD repeat protein
MYLKPRTYRMAIALIALAMLLPLLSVPELSATGTSSVTYEYHFARPTIDHDSEDRVYTLVGLENDTNAGSPILPIESLMLAMRPDQTVVDVRVECSDAVALEIATDYPCNPAESQTGDGSTSFEEGAHGAYDYSGSYILEGTEIVCIDLWPVYLDVDADVLYYVSDFTITIITKANEGSFVGDMDRVRELVDNPDDVPALESSEVSSSFSVLPSGSYEYLIITDEDLIEPFQTLATWKCERNDQGSICANIASVLVTLEYIKADSSFWGTPSTHGGTGNDTQTIVRNFITAAHEEWGVKYVLIGGDEDVIPSRKVYVTAIGKSATLPADIYFSALDGNWDNDGDGRYGESSSQGSAGEEADLLAEVYVGRAPVSTSAEAWNFINKTILYEKSYTNEYGTDLLFVGEALDSYTYGDWYKEEVYDDVLADKNLTLMTLYEEKGTFSESAFVSGLNSGVHIVNHMGHGNYATFGDLTISDVNGLTNDLPFILYTQACMVAGFDQSTDSIAEKFVTGEHGAVAFIGNSRYGWYSPGSTSGTSQQYDLSFFSQVYEDNVTNLGKALSLSKEEHASSAASPGTYRWVYMELNLLGDPETEVLMHSRPEHDLALKAIVIDSCFLHEECKVSVRVQNLGQCSEEGTVHLYVDGTLVDTTVVTLAPDTNVITNLYWTPALYQEYELTAEVVCSLDSVPSNDERTVIAPVDLRISEDTLWEDETITLAGGFLIEDGVTLEVRDCAVNFPSGVSMDVAGTLDASGSTFSGPGLTLNSTGDVLLEGCGMGGLSNKERPNMDGGRLVLRNTTITGGMGWMLDGTDLEVLSSYLIDQISEWSVSLSEVTVEGLVGKDGGGLRLSNVTGALRNLTWSDADIGLAVEWSGGLTMHDISLTNNVVDITISGDDASHFLQDVVDVEMTDGPLSIIYDVDNITLSGPAASLYLVDCHDITVEGLHLQRNGQGLTLVDCTGVSVVGNAIEDCAIGIMAIGSEGTLWSNDMIGNERQVSQSGSSLTFNLDYPAGGNYWSDNDVVDEKSGEDQDRTGADGTDDCAYDTNDAYDRYPKVARCSFVYDTPIAAFITSSASFDIIDEVTFTDISSSGSGITNWTWDLGDGDVTFGKEVQHLYAVKEMVTVTLTVTDAKGLVDSVSKDFIVVNYAPDCSFSYSPSQPEIAGSVNFYDLSTDQDGTTVTWSWDFRDGSTSTATSPSHSFSDAGDYYVVLTVTDNDGDADSCTRKVAVGNDAPVASFDYSPTSLVGMQYTTFTANCTDADGEVVNWSWDFGDGTTGNGTVIDHRFPRSGTYNVVLTVVDDDDARDTCSVTVAVSNAQPNASFSFQEGAIVLTSVQFTDGSIDPDGKIVSWHWEFGDGSTASIRSPEHVYISTGTYNVTLTVRDNDGATDTVIKTIMVSNRTLHVSIDIDGTTFRSLDEIVMRSNTTCPDDIIVDYQWDFGDGSFGTDGSVSHAYPSPGTYTVTLTVWNDEGTSASTSVTVVIVNRAPQASIDVTSDDIRSLEEVVLVADATDMDGEVMSYLWEFGDGSNATGASVHHAYSAPGTYIVTLTCVDDLDTATVVNVTLQVLNLPPGASIVVEQSSRSPLEMHFVANSSDLDGSLTAWYWEFGDGSTGNGSSALHLYSRDGTYQVNLTVTDDNGATCATTALVEVSEGTVVMSNVTCAREDGEWTFTADLLNDGPLNVTVVVIVNASGVEHQKEVVLVPGEVNTVQISLDGFDGGAVSAVVECDADWDSDLSDNTWAGTVTPDEAMDVTVIILAVLIVACVAITAMVLWRRR